MLTKIVCSQFSAPIAEALITADGRKRKRPELITRFSGGRSPLLIPVEVASPKTVNGIVEVIFITKKVLRMRMYEEERCQHYRRGILFGVIAGAT